MSVEAVMIGVFGTLIAAILGVLTAKITANASRKSAKESHKLEERRVELEGYRSLLSDYRIEIEQLPNLRKRVDDLEKQSERDKKIIRALVRWSRAMRDEILRLGGVVPERPDVLDMYDLDDKTES